MAVFMGLGLVFYTLLGSRIFFLDFQRFTVWCSSFRALTVIGFYVIPVVFVMQVRYGSITC